MLVTISIANKYISVIQSEIWENIVENEIINMIRM